MTRQASTVWWAGLPAEQESLRPLYSRLLGLRHVNPGGFLCFVFFEGAISLAVLLGLAELVSWWAVLLLPASVAAMVKVNDEVAAAVARSAARMPRIERDRLRRELQPAIGRARVPEAVTTVALEATGSGPSRAGSASPPPVRRRGGWLALVWARRKLTIVLPKIAETPVIGSGEPIGEPDEPIAEQAVPGRRRLPAPGPGGRSYQLRQCSLNSRPLERPIPWEWPTGLDSPGSARQRNRQSGKRRYK